MFYLNCDTIVTFLLLQLSHQKKLIDVTNPMASITVRNPQVCPPYILNLRVFYYAFNWIRKAVRHLAQKSAWNSSLNKLLLYRAKTGICPL